jgi:hypothetical protein
MCAGMTYVNRPADLSRLHRHGFNRPGGISPDSARRSLSSRCVRLGDPMIRDGRPCVACVVDRCTAGRVRHGHVMPCRLVARSTSYKVTLALSRCSANIALY